MTKRETTDLALIIIIIIIIIFLFGIFVKTKPFQHEIIERSFVCFGYCNIAMLRYLIPRRFVRMHFRSRERNDHVVNVSFPGTKLPSNIRSHKLSSLTTVALLVRRPTQYSMHYYELFNYDYRVRLK